MSEALDLGSLEPRVIEVRTTRKTFWLIEPGEGALLIYRNAVAKALKVGRDGKAEAGEGLPDTQSLLVSICLHEEIAENGKPAVKVPVSLSIIRGWPHRTIEPLFDKALELSGLKIGKTEAEQETDAERKEQAAKN